MRHRSILFIIVGMFASCSPNIDFAPPGEWKTYTDYLEIEMHSLGYPFDWTRAHADEFYQLNKRYFELTDLEEVKVYRNADGRFIKSSTSGKVYKYSFKAGTTIMLPIKSMYAYRDEMRQASANPLK